MTDKIKIQTANTAVFPFSFSAAKTVYSSYRYTIPHIFEKVNLFYSDFLDLSAKKMGKFLYNFTEFFNFPSVFR